MKSSTIIIVMLASASVFSVCSGAEPCDPDTLEQLTQVRLDAQAAPKPPSVPFDVGVTIPGLRQDAVPQGLTYIGEQDRVIISHYGDGEPSRISVLDNKSGKVTSSVVLKESPEDCHYGHVGGVATLNGSMWVASEGKVFQYDLEPLLAEPAPAVAVPVAVHEAETKASFCTATDDMLFVGEFAHRSKFPFAHVSKFLYDHVSKFLFADVGKFRTDESHHLKDRKGKMKYAWVCGYSAEDPMGTPSCVLSVRQRVQGMHVTGERVFLSLSYGRKNRSTIVIYRNPLDEAPHSEVTLSDGTSVPLWYLDGENYLSEIDFPPMAEGIAMIGNRLAVLSESGAAKFQKGGKEPLDTLLLLDVRDR